MPKIGGFASVCMFYSCCIVAENVKNRVRMQPKSSKPAPTRTGAINALQKEDLPVHGWYRFVLSFPPHLVRQYIDAFALNGKDLVLDPFCGTGTTLVEAKKTGLPSIGCDAHPFAAMVSRVKTNWNLKAAVLQTLLSRILKSTERMTTEYGLASLSFDARLLQETSASVNGFRLTEEEERILPTGFLSQRPLQRLLMLRQEIEKQTEDQPPEVREFFLVALAHVIAQGAGNFAFGPEIYRTKPKPDYDVLGHFARHTERMVSETAAVQASSLAATPSRILSADARELAQLPEDISAIITSPPYPNEKDYTRTTRVESILLRLMTDKAGLRGIKESLLRSNTRNIFVDDRDGEEVREFASIQKICRQIEARRLELNKDSGFERLYHKVVAHYFGGLRRHLRSLRPKLRAKARLAYVVGDQLSYLMVPIATARLLAEVARTEGYKIIGCDLWRERVGTKVRNSRTNQTTVRIREEVLLLQKT
jgi:DNA modification methylase